MNINLTEIGAIARCLGWGASDILQSYYHDNVENENLQIEEKKDGPVTMADKAVNDYILDNLREIYSEQNFGYLSEETYQINQSPFSQPWVWIIDPLDGTRDFIDHTGDYAVHIALVYQGRPMLAVVVCPESGKLYYAQKGAGTFVETRDGEIIPLQVSQRDRLSELSLVVSRTHRDDRFNQLLEKLPCKEQKHIGSVGCKIAAIIEQNADMYISLSGKSAPKDWDMAAPELILTEAGGKFTHLDGSCLKYNQRDVNQWGCLIATNGNIHASICNQIKKILDD